MEIFKKELQTDIRPFVLSSCALDLELIKNYPGGLEACVNDIVNNIGKTTYFYSVRDDDGQVVGYFAQAIPINEVSVLEAFLLRKGFRTPECVKLFWDLIKSSFESDIYIAIDEWNVKALNHLIKNEFVIQNKVEYYGRKCILLKFNYKG
jgi:hypothetical protein